MIFAECAQENTRQNQSTRQSHGLPCVFLAHGKEIICRVLFCDTRQSHGLPCAFFLAHGKEIFCDTRQSMILPCVLF